MLHIVQILILAIIQGAAEMLPVSSSAHVTIAARLMGFDRGTAYDWAFLLIMLHTGNMLAVLVYFRSRLKSFLREAPALILATFVTLALGGILYVGIKHFFLAPGQDIEDLFTRIPLIAAALFSVGVIILVAGVKENRAPGRQDRVRLLPAAVIGAVQAIALPFRGFSRSGSTISTGFFCGVERIRAEEFSFALAVLLTPAVIAFEARHLVGHGAGQRAVLGPVVLPSLLGMAFSFVAGLLALRWLSRWLERGRWHCFGIYCIVAAAIVLGIHFGMPERASQSSHGQVTSTSPGLPARS